MFAVFIKLGWFFREQWKRYSIAVALLMITGILDLIPPRLIGFLIDGIHLGNLTDPEFVGAMGIWAGIAIAGYLMTYIWFRQLFGGSFVLERHLRTRLMGHFLSMTPTFFEKSRTGDLMARATNDLRAVSMTAGFGILTLVDASIFMTMVLVAMAWLISWKLTVAACLPLPLMALIIAKYGRQIHHRFMQAQQAFGGLNDQVLETISGVRVNRAFVQERRSERQFTEMTEDVFRKNVAVARIEALFQPTIKVIVGASYLIGLCYGGYLVALNEMTLGDLVTFNVFLGMLIWPMMAFGELVNIMQRGNASLDRVNETLAYEPDVASATEPIDVSVPESITFERVTFRYPQSATDNLRDISFHMKRGETLGVVGRTGSGKTTLLRQLLREYPSGSGTIALSGVALEDLDLERLRGWIGYVPQQPVLFSRSIRENIVFGHPTASEPEIERALELASFSKDIAFLPDGLDTLVGEKGVALSGGQKQRVSIARAMIADPEILLLDDALSAVDAKTEAEIIAAIRKERAGKTTLISTHRLSAVQHAEHIIVLDEGKVVEAGTHAQLLERSGWYKQQYDRQQIEAALEG